MKSKTDSNIAINCKATIAGLLIGLGVIINVQTDPPILGATLFSFGLLTIINLQLPLFTGRVGFLEPHLPMILLANFFGIFMTVGAYMLVQPEFYDLLLTAAIGKFSKEYIQMLIGGIFCGMLIHFAVKCKVPYLTVMAVVIFILTGAEHCIADFPYFAMILNLESFIKLLLVIMGNSIGAIFIEEMISYE